VSRVINDHPNVAAATRDRVLNAIAELGFHPSYAARSLAGRRSKTIAVITAGLGYYGPTQMLVNIERNARSLGYDLVFSDIDPLDETQNLAAVDRVLRWSADGVIIIAPFVSQQTNIIEKKLAGLPIVHVDVARESNLPSAIVDQHAGSVLATQHLLDLGHQHIAEISGPLMWYDAIGRHEGWHLTMQSAGLDTDLSVAGDWSVASGYRAATQLLDATQFTAVVIGNDEMAIGAMCAITERGLRIPEDISVVGFDDIPAAAYLYPKLTTIRQDFSRLGSTALKYLIERIEEPTAPPTQYIVQPHLQIRESTASPAQ
jgi:LacI family transcriptional regulator